jgi:SAM-dependent methyltransferase
MSRDLDGAGPNAQQVAYWNESGGPTWVSLEAQLDLQLAPFGGAAMDAARPRPGECALDVGCGYGTTTIELARRVGPAGRALGVDLSAPMLARAAARANALGLPHVRFELADAQTHRLEVEACDLLYSRFGVMFFADPVAAFANLRRALAPGGRLAFVCWQAVDENPWFLLPTTIAARFVPIAPPADPHAPGPFAFADAERVLRILAAAGFHEARCTPLRIPFHAGSDLDEAVRERLLMGSIGAALRAADDATRRAVAAAVGEALLPYQTADGVRMPAAAWVVTATRPR